MDEHAHQIALWAEMETAASCYGKWFLGLEGYAPGDTAPEGFEIYLATDEKHRDNVVSASYVDDGKTFDRYYSTQEEAMEAGRSWVKALGLVEVPRG